MAKASGWAVPWYGWASTLLELREEEFPNFGALAQALRSDTPVPKEVREFLAGYIEGSINRPRGRTKYQTHTAIELNHEEEHMRAVFADELDRAQASEEDFNGTPFEFALERTAAIIGAELGVHLAPEGIKTRLRLRDRTKGKARTPGK